MKHKAPYKKNYEKLISDKSICGQNRDLFKKFFQYQEYKLKRINNLPALDEGCYQTLLRYVQRFRNLNRWLDNKPWEDLTEEDIKRVYDDLEDGKILNARGQPVGDRESYYSKIMKSKPFRMVGKSEMAKNVMEFSKPQGSGEVRFIDETAFKHIETVTSQIKYKALLWMAWDYGENINSLLKVQRKLFRRVISQETGEPEYLLRFPKEILKRSRRSRTEPSLYSETVEYLDMMLKDKNDDDYVFDFRYGSAKKFLDRAVEKSGAKCVTGQKPTWKDFRSGMACHLLNIGWTREEIDARLGHSPSSRELDKYITFQALDRKKSKQKLHANRTQHLKQEIEQFRLREKHHTSQIQRLQMEMEKQRHENSQINQEVGVLKHQVSNLIATFNILLKNPKRRPGIARALYEETDFEILKEDQQDSLV